MNRNERLVRQRRERLQEQLAQHPCRVARRSMLQLRVDKVQNLCELARGGALFDCRELASGAGDAQQRAAKVQGRVGDAAGRAAQRDQERAPPPRVFSGSQSSQ